MCINEALVRNCVVGTVENHRKIIMIVCFVKYLNQVLPEVKSL